MKGDAIARTDLGDNRFDFGVSIFGAMYAPKPFDVDSKMVGATSSAR